MEGGGCSKTRQEETPRKIEHPNKILKRPPGHQQKLQEKHNQKNLTQIIRVTYMWVYICTIHICPYAHIY